MINFEKISAAQVKYRGIIKEEDGVMITKIITTDDETYYGISYFADKRNITILCENLKELKKEFKQAKKEIKEMKKKIVKYLYRGEEYDSEDEVGEAIIERIGGNYNNIDPSATAEFENEWIKEVEIIEKIKF
ncbi:MAG: hypothetical protein M0R51_08970 [Clostridia bacterium]|jgi:uncharacterized protein YyaL (SSP411 family)|nr:hypothetical protein [Clostridia bacterium]